MTQAWFVTNFGIPRIINNDNRIQYAPLMGGYAAEWGLGSGNDVQVYGVCIAPLVWINALTEESLIASGNHERIHCEQDTAVRDNSPAGNVYRLLDAEYGGVTSAGYIDFAEPEAYLSEFNDSSIGWLHHTGTTTLGNFEDYYSDAITRSNGMSPGTTKTAARSYLKTLYQDIPFEEMKRSGYNYYVRPPE